MVLCEVSTGPVEIRERMGSPGVGVTGDFKFTPEVNAGNSTWEEQAVCILNN